MKKLLLLALPLAGLLMMPLSVALVVAGSSSCERRPARTRVGPTEVRRRDHCGCRFLPGRERPGAWSAAAGRVRLEPTRPLPGRRAGPGTVPPDDLGGVRRRRAGTVQRRWNRRRVEPVRRNLLRRPLRLRTRVHGRCGPRRLDRAHAGRLQRRPVRGTPLRRCPAVPGDAALRCRHPGARCSIRRQRHRLAGRRGGQQRSRSRSRS